MKKTKRMLSLLLALLLALSAMPPMQASAAGGRDLSQYVKVTGFEIYNNDTNSTVVVSSESSVGADSLIYTNGLSHWSKKNIVIYWELDLTNAPSSMTVEEDDYFTISLPQSNWSISNTAISDITVNELGSSVTAGTWSITSKVAKITLGEKTDGANNLSGTLSTGYICYPSFIFLEDKEIETAIGSLSKYYKYIARSNSNITFNKFAKSMASSTNNSITWDLHIGRDYLSNKAATVIDNNITTIDPMTELFVVDKIDNASSITAISTAIYTRIYAKPPSGTTNTPIGSMDMGSKDLTGKFVNAGNGSDDGSYGTSYADLDAFKAHVKTASTGIGSYGIYKTNNAYYVVWYINSVPISNLTYGDVFGTTSIFNYYQSSWELAPADESWYDAVYGANDPVYNLLIRYYVTYNDVVLEDKKINNGANFYYKQNGSDEDAFIDPNSVTGYLYAANGTAVLPWNSAALIKYDTDGTTGLGGASFQLQYWDDSLNNNSGGWVDYYVNGALYEGTTESNGQLMVKDLIAGDYRFVEIEAATGYDVNTVKYYADKADMGDSTKAIIDSAKHFTVSSTTDGSYIYATNAISTHTVSYYGNYNGNGDNLAYSDSGIDYGTSYDVLSDTDASINISNTGFTFAGWTTQPDGTGTIYGAGSVITITDDVELYAKWIETAVPPTYDVIYNANGGTGSYSESVEKDATYTVLSDTAVDIKRVGYTFMGWERTHASGGTTLYSAGDSFPMPENSVTLYAQWELTTYTVTYKANYVDNGVEQTHEDTDVLGPYTILGQTASSITAPDGYEFDRWNTERDGSGTTYNRFTSYTINADLTLYAIWTKKDIATTVALSYNGNGSTGGDVPVATTYYNSGDSVIVKGNDGNFVKDGHTFTGWNTAPDGSGEAYDPTDVNNNTFEITEDTILYAQWKVDESAVYTVTYHSSYNDATDVYTNIPAGEYTVKTYDSTTLPQRSGYTFLGWATDDANGDVVYAAVDCAAGTASFTIEDEDNYNLYAKWRYNGGSTTGGGDTTYSVNYRANGGTGSHTDSGLSYNSSYTILTQTSTGIAYEGKTLTGWNTSADGSGTSYSSGTVLTIRSNVILYAQWADRVDLTDDKVPLETFSADHFAYVIGYPDGYVRPENNILRSEVTTIFFRLLNTSVRAEYWSTMNNYSDVQSEAWYNNSISVMTNLGVITGYPDGNFGPQDNITRGELAAIAARFAKLNGAATTTSRSFSDISGHWAEEYILYAASVGYIDGYTDGTYHPDEYITRAEFIAIVNRMLGRTPESTSDLLDDMITWPDNADTSKWYYLDVQEATNSHYYELKETLVPGRGYYYEKWTVLRQAPDWSVLEKPDSKPEDLVIGS